MTATTNGCAEFADLLAAYALDALDEDEAARVARHLEGCPRCADEVAAHRETIGLLANVGGVAPEGVWETIASRVEAIPKPVPPADVFPTTAPRWGSAEDILASAQPVEAEAPPVASPTPDGGAPGRRLPAGLGWVPWGVAAAAVVAAAVLIGVQTARIDHLNHRINQLASASQQAQGFQGLASALVDPDAVHLILATTGPGATPVGQLVILPSGGAYLVGSRLPALPVTRTYQLWSIVGGRAVSVGVLGAHPTTAAFSVDPRARSSAYLVTAEPTGGVVAPTSAPLAHAPA